MPRALCKACRGEGCETCYQSGYSGYAPIFEIFFLNEEWREFIRHGNLERVKNIAIKEGFCDLRTEAIKKIDNGLTTVEEVLSKGVVI
jgi:type II secretory ATPase GspE/PulE/Tfp pilus assembly ATPase PilB-like protein